MKSQKPVIVLAGALVLLVTVTAIRAQPRADAKKDFRGVTLSADETKRLQDTFRGLDPKLFSVTISQPGKPTIRLGSAQMKDLTVIGGFHNKANIGDKAGNEVVSTVDTYLKTVWTADAQRLAGAKVNEINAMLNKAATR